MVKYNRLMRAALLGGASAVVWLKCVESVSAQEILPDILIGSPEPSAAPAGQGNAPAEQSGANFSYSGGPLINPAQNPEPNPVSSVTPEGIRILGGPAQASSYKPLDLMPSVIEDSADPYGLSFTRSITVRGVSDFFLSRTIDGLPIAGIIGGADLIDLSNLSRIDLYRGSLQANQGLGFSSAA